jgi:hypothetical protein
VIRKETTVIGGCTKLYSICPPKIQPPNVSFSGNRVFADVIVKDKVILEYGGPPIQ